jgi:hypothetical protein
MTAARWAGLLVPRYMHLCADDIFKHKAFRTGTNERGEVLLSTKLFDDSTLAS